MQETNLFLQMIEKCRQGLSKEGKEKKTVIASLEHIAAKLQNRPSAPLPTNLWPIVDLSGIKHVPHPGSPAIDFMKARIYPGPLALISNKISEIETLGLVEKGTDGDRLSVNHTKNLISSIRAHVSISVSIPCILLFLRPLPLYSDRGRRSHINQYDPNTCCIEPKSEWGRCRYRS